MSERFGLSLATGLLVAGLGTACAPGEQSHVGGPEMTPATTAAATTPPAEASPSPTATSATQTPSGARIEAMPGPLTGEPQVELDVEVIREAPTFFEMGGEQGPKVLEIGDYVIAFCLRPDAENYVGMIVGEGVLYAHGQDQDGQDVFNPPVAELEAQLPVCEPGKF